VVGILFYLPFGKKIPLYVHSNFLSAVIRLGFSIGRCDVIESRYFLEHPSGIQEISGLETLFLFDQKVLALIRKKLTGPTLADNMYSPLTNLQLLEPVNPPHRKHINIEFVPRTDSKDTPIYLFSFI
jgi:hypothetical protein